MNYRKISEKATRLLITLCFISSPLFFYSQDLQWFNQIKNITDDIDINNLIVDSAGNVYIGGSFDMQTAPQVNFFGTTMTASHEQMGFLAKVNSSGTIQWMNKFGSPSSTVGYSPISMVEKNGFIYVVGSFTYTSAPGLDFDPGSGTNYIQTTNTDMFISKYNTSTGAMVWAYSYSGTNGSDLATGITIDNNENIYVTGFVDNGSTPDDFNVKAPGAPAALGIASKKHVFLAKYDKDCNFLWRSNVINGTAKATTITIDLTNNFIYMAGGMAQSGGNPKFSGVTLTCTAGAPAECFIAKYDFSGTCIWVKNTGRITSNSLSNLIRSIKVDNIGNIYVVGSFGSPSDFDPSASTSSISPVGSFDGFVAKYTSSGALTWKYGIGSSSFGEAINSIDVTPVGDIFIGGTLHGAAESNPEGSSGSKMVGAGTYTIFFGQYDKDFKWEWAYGITSPAATVSSNSVNSVIIDKNDPLAPVYIYGYMSPSPVTENFNPSGTGIFAPSLVPKTSTGGTGGNNANGFLAKYSTSLILPITLTNFNAKLDNDIVDLNWTTSSEINNDYFTIERSKDAINWKELATIKGAGNSNNTLSYLYYDKLPLKGTSYYRLKQTDFNGLFSYSKIKSIKTQENRKINFYPNPANNELIFNLKNSHNKALTIDIIDGMGQKVLTAFFSANETNRIQKINLQKLPKGIYLVVVKTSTVISSSKLIIKH